MAKYSLKISEKAQKDLLKIKKSGKKNDILKIEQLFKEIILNPRFGSGKPEHLKGYNGEVWSRRINQKDRLIYEIIEKPNNLVVVVSALGHYE
jgi:toxin YoeB